MLRFGILYLLSAASLVGAALIELNESPAQAEEWGYRPFPGQTLAVNPPSFCWRPQKGLTWQLQCCTDESFVQVSYQADGLVFNVHCPAQVFAPGTYFWRYRGTAPGQTTAWSQIRSFHIPEGVAQMPMPAQEELIGRIPKTHPRLFLRPEKLEELRGLARGSLKSQYEGLLSSSRRALRTPASVKEPPTYPPGMERGSESWRKMWWGNRERTQRALGSAATLGFTWLLSGDDRFGQEAKRILLACAEWDPKGSTGYRYNDEAGMPYTYYFSRAYTFINELLTEEEKQRCRAVMKVRGEEMYDHLYPRHLWQPYSSHSNRAWHFLGEVALAFHGEIEGTEDWFWFAMNVFYNLYPVWSDDDGGWHEGALYWDSYQRRFTWWADIMREVLDINAYDKPYYSKIGYYPMYLLPPGKVGAGFGDLNAPRKAEQGLELMSVLAAQAQNPHWQWYVEQLGGSTPTDGYVGFIRGALPAVTPNAPDDLPSSRLFRGIGQAMLNTQIENARESVQIVFKSSPFGTQSHGYEANNSFLLWAYGKRLLIRSGYRDSYGSDHHRDWMWSTRSVNNITVNHKGQGRRSAAAQGEITAFQTSPELDVVVGEAGGAYETPLDRFTRALIFVKPDLLIVYDRLVSPRHATFQYHLHALNEMEIKRDNRLRVQNGDVHCQIDFYTPEALSISQTNQYDPNPRPRIKLREWHVTASTIVPAQDMSFVTLYRIQRGRRVSAGQASFQEGPVGYVLTASAAVGNVTVLMPKSAEDSLEAGNLSTDGNILVHLERRNKTSQTWVVEDLK
ncbi:DUF4962 domain-containing protein [Planctomycetota bacterium]